ncbi:MAG: sugar phosphate isomerase/epimerase [Phycisphaerae bacterium]|nr:sugar phosphate isomerase/epimerase [Phycisphaerae bacterium]
MIKPLGLQLYSVRDAAAKDFIGVLKQVADIGYQGVEFAGLHDHSPAEIRKVIDDLGMTASSAHCPLPTPESVNEIVETAKALGYDMVIAGNSPDEFKTLDGIKSAADTFQTAIELLASHDLRMIYHNHWWEFNEIDGRLGFDILLELAPDILGELDIYWASNFGKVDVPAVAAKYAARLPMLHVKDGPLVQGQPLTAVGAGKMDIPAAINAADPGTVEWLVVEIDECATDMMQAIRESYQYLTEHGKK